MTPAKVGLLAVTLLIVPPSSHALPMGIGDPPQAKDSGPESTESVNAAVIAARAATKEKRFADSEALMLKITNSNPTLIVPWIELGLAQLGLKKYPDAENSFKVGLGIDAQSLKRAHSDDFYQNPEERTAVAPTATHSSRNTVGGKANTADKRTPDILGTGYASLGEIYVHEGKIPEAEEAFDMAVKSNPPMAASYRRNETIFFFQAGNADAQFAAAEKAIALDPGRAALYYFKGQALVSKTTIDPKTQKMILPPGCAEAYQKYLSLEPNGQFAADAKGVLASAK
jgi:tetratricopeptide (TPR) repeat protein